MSKLIIDATTGTVLNVEQCFLVDTDNLSASDSELLDNASDSELGELAQRAGKSILVSFGSDTGWGDNKYRYTVSYSPMSIRDEADSMLDGGIYEDDEDQKDALRWALREASDEELGNISDFIMGADHVWDGFRENLMEGLMFFYHESKEAK